MRYVTNVAHVLSQRFTKDSSVAQKIYLRINWLKPHTKSSPFHPTMQGHMKYDDVFCVVLMFYMSCFYIYAYMLLCANNPSYYSILNVSRF